MVSSNLNPSKSLMRMGFDLVYPPRCPLCHLALQESGGNCTLHSEICAVCAIRIAPNIPHSCPKCAAPVGPYSETLEKCNHCRSDRFQFNSIIRLGVYQDDLRSACLLAKQKFGHSLMGALGELLWQQEQRAFSETPVDVVVPIPMHWIKRISGRHHATNSLGHVLARSLQVDLGSHILSKVRRTPSQSSLSPSKRRKNLRKVFRVNRFSELSGANILLVDDVLTTGTTANEAAKMLLQAGAKRVTVAVIARGLGQKVATNPIEI